MLTLIVFVDPSNPGGKPDFYIYKLIEILLPRAMVKPGEWPKAVNSNDTPIEVLPPDVNPRFHLKLVELWAQNSTERKGWLKVQSLV